MNCPVCAKKMHKIRWEITNNFKMADEFAEYDKVTYHCKADDAWVATEIPVAKKTKDKK